MSKQDALRHLLAARLDAHDAHVGFERAVADVPEEMRGVVPEGFAHSCWQLVEHLRRAQADILDFCVNPEYVSPTSMEEYWPAAEPENDSMWRSAIDGFREDIAALRRLALDESVDLFDLAPTGRGAQTYARELLLAADHDAYHLGQLICTRRAFGCWRDAPGWG